MNKYTDYLHPTLVELCDAKKFDRALEVADMAIDTAEKDENLNAYLRAEKLQEAWQGLGFVRDLSGDVEGAAEAVEAAFRYDSILQFPAQLYVDLLMQGSAERFDQTIADIVYNQYDRYWNDEDQQEALEALLESVKGYAKNHPETNKMINYVEANKRGQEIRMDCEATSDDVFAYMEDELKRNSVPPEIVYMFGGKLLYFQDEEELAWKEAFSKVDPEVLREWPTYFDMALLCRLTIHDDVPDDLPLSKPKILNQRVSLAPALLRLGPVKYEESWKPDLIETLEPEERELCRRVIHFTRRHCEQLLREYDAFEEGTINGYATSMYNRAEVVRYLGATYEYEFNYQKAVEILEGQMFVFPTYPLASLLASVALDARDGETTVAALNWIIDNEGDDLDFEDLFRCYRLRVWGFALQNDRKAFLEAYKIYIDQLPGIFRCGHFHAFCREQILPPSIRGFGYELRWAANNFAEGVDHLLEQHPDDAKLLAIRSYCQSFNPREITYEWVKEKGEYARGIIEKATPDFSEENEIGLSEFEKMMALIGIETLSAQATLDQDYDDQEASTAAARTIDTERLEGLLTQALELLKTDPKDVVGPTADYSEDERPVSMLRLKIIDGYTLLGDVYDEIYDYTRSRESFEKGIKLAEEVLKPLPENVVDNPFEISSLGLASAPDFCWMNLQMRMGESYEVELNKLKEDGVTGKQLEDLARNAIKHYSEAEKQLPILPRGWMRLGNLCSFVEDWEQAIDNFRGFGNWFEEDEEEVEHVAYAFLNAAAICAEQGDKEEAEVFLERYENLNYTHDDEAEYKERILGKKKKKGLLGGLFSKKKD